MVKKRCPKVEINWEGEKGEEKTGSEAKEMMKGSKNTEVLTEVGRSTSLIFL